MKITFHKISWKNLLSTGNAGIELDLDSHHTSLLVGDSGNGKSTLLDALAFGLFGKPFRNVTKAQIINSVNNADCVVEVEFSVGKRRYSIKRGIKPTVFEVYCDGVLINQSSNAKDYQTYLESNVLGFDYRAFKQVIVLGAADFTPFMQLSAGDRRGLIEDLLDINVFSQMNVLLKQRASTLKTDLSECEFKIQSTNEKITLVEKHLKSQNEDLQERIGALEEKLETEKSTIPTLLEQKDALIKTHTEVTNEINEQQKVRTEFIAKRDAVRKEFKDKLVVARKEINQKIDALANDGELELAGMVTARDKIVKAAKRKSDEVLSEARANRDSKILKCEKIRTKTEQEIERLEKDVTFYSKNDSCSVCRQTIDPSFKSKVVDSATTEIIALQEKLKSIDTAVGVIEQEYAAVQEAEKLNAKNIDVEVSEHNEKIDAYRVQLNKDLKALRDSLVSKEKSIEDELTEAEARLGKLESEDPELRKRYASALSAVEQIEYKISNAEKLCRALTSEIEQLKKPKAGPQNTETDLLNLKEQLQKQLDVKAELVDTKELYSMASELLKDTGIKSRMIKHYLPQINTAVNTYLQQMNFFVSFELDEQFNETIKSRHRDNFSYANFSEGEKQRIDLALLFAWRAVAKGKNSISANLLVLDEILDSYLSDGATQNVIDMLYSDTLNDSNIFVISHKDNIADRFERVMKFEKQSEFSVMTPQ